MRSMRRGALVAGLLALLAQPAWAAAAPGAFTLTLEKGLYTLQADQAKVDDILSRLATLSGIPVFPDPADQSTVTVSLAGVTLEKLVTAVSRSHAVVYLKDPASGGFRVEKVVAAASGEVSAKEAAELTGAQVVKSILERARAVGSYRQEKSTAMSIMGNRMEFKGEMWQRGNRFRMEMTVPPSDSKQIIISDGETMYTYMPLMNLVQKIDFQKLKAGIREQAGAEGAPDLEDIWRQPAGSPLAGLKEENLNYLGNEVLNGENVYVLEGKAPANAGGMTASPFTPVTARYWMSAADGLPRRVTMYGKGNQEMYSEDYRNVTVDPPMDDDLFTFTPPEGAQVIDMTEGILNIFEKMSKEKPAPK